MKKKLVAQQVRDDGAQGAADRAARQKETDAREIEPVPEGAAGEGAREKEIVHTQKEIDQALGRRLRRERERWEMKHQRALTLEQVLGEAGVEEAIEAVLSQRMGLKQQDVRQAMEGAHTPQELAEAARRLATAREAEELALEYPDFDIQAAMENERFRTLVESGQPMRLAYAFANMDGELERAREAGRMEIMRALKERGSRPLPIQARGAGAAVDFRSMPDAALRSIDERLKRGERVRL